MRTAVCTRRGSRSRRVGGDTGAATKATIFQINVVLRSTRMVPEV
jgi:hypothetical protein